MRITNKFLLLSAFLFPIYASAESLEIVIVQDQFPVQKESLDISASITKTFELRENLELKVVVTDNTHTESRLFNSETGEVLHTTNQTGRSTKGPNLYLICAGKLLTWASPAHTETPSCPK
jgi:hypothetical protein